MYRSSYLIFLLVFTYISIQNIACLAQQTQAGFKHELITIAKGKSEDLFVKATSWAILHGGANNTNIQYEDKEAGRLIITHKIATPGIRDILGLYYGTDHVIYFMTIDTKDDKCRIVLSGFEHIGGNYKAGLRISRWIKLKPGRPAPSYGSLDQEIISRRIDRKRWKRTQKVVEDKVARTLTNFEQSMQAIEKDF